MVARLALANKEERELQIPAPFVPAYHHLILYAFTDTTDKKNVQ